MRTHLRLAITYPIQHHIHMSIVRRGTTFHLRKRVPRRYMPVETREFVLLSLHTDSESAAKLKAES